MPSRPLTVGAVALNNIDVQNKLENKIETLRVKS
jgi:hypothetical protein